MVRVVIWAWRIAVAVAWLAMVLGLMPSGAGMNWLVSAEEALTNRVPDPIGFAFVSGLLVATWIVPEVWKHIRQRLYPDQILANYREWDRLKSLATWQVAWLWYGLEPLNKESSGTPAYPTFRRLKEHLDAGLVKGAQRNAGSWKDASLGRQALVDYAHEIGEKPPFLFPEQRGWLKRQKALWFDYREATASEIREYADFYRWYAAGQKRQHSVEEVRTWIIGELKAGRMVSIGRPRHRGTDWPYVHIPRRCWRRAQFDWDGILKDGEKEYASILIKEVKGK